MALGVRRGGWVAVGNRDVALGARLEGCVVVGNLDVALGELGLSEEPGCGIGRVGS